MSNLPLTTLSEFCKSFAGNWKKFDSFAWHDKNDNPELWGIYHTHHRDSGLLDQSNANAIAEELKRFTVGNHPTVTNEHFGHWAVGWVDGLAVQVYTPKNRPTKAAEVLYD